MAIPIRKVEARLKSLKDELSKPGQSEENTAMKRGAIIVLSELPEQYKSRKK